MPFISAFNGSFYIRLLEAVSSSSSQPITVNYSEFNSNISGQPAMSSTFASSNQLRTNGTYTIVTDPNLSPNSTDPSTSPGGSAVRQAGWAWIVRNSDGAIMKSWNSMLDGDAPDDASIVTETDTSTSISSKYICAMFGWSVAINDNYAFVSAVYRPVGGTVSNNNHSVGRGYVFAIDLTTFNVAFVFEVLNSGLQTITNPSGSSSGGTAWAEQEITATNSSLFIGAPDALKTINSTQYEAGAVTYYDISDPDPLNWPSAPSQTLISPIDFSTEGTFWAAPDGSNYSNLTFGTSLNASGNKLFVQHTHWSHYYNYINGNWQLNHSTSEIQYPANGGFTNNVITDFGSTLVQTSSYSATSGNFGPGKLNALSTASGAYSTLWQTTIASTNGYPGGIVTQMGEKYVFTGDGNHDGTITDEGIIFAYNVSDGSDYFTINNPDPSSIKKFGLYFDVKNNSLVTKVIDVATNQAGIMFVDLSNDFTLPSVSLSLVKEHSTNTDGTMLESGGGQQFHIDANITTLNHARLTVFRDYHISPDGDWSDITNTNRTDTATAVDAYGITFTDDGLTAFVGTAPSPSGYWGIDKYTLTTPYRMNTSTKVQGFQISSPGNFTNISISSDGTKIVLAPEYLYPTVPFRVWTLSTPYDLTTATLQDQLLPEMGTGQANESWVSAGCVFTHDGKYMITLRIDGSLSQTYYRKIVLSELTIPWDVSTEASRTILYDVESHGSPNNIHLSDDQTKLYLHVNTYIVEFDVKGLEIPPEPIVVPAYNWEYATQQGLLAPTADASYAPYGAYGAGDSVDISDNGNIAIVGAPQTATSGGSSVGSAYIFSRDEEGVWSQDYEFENPDPTPLIFSPYQAGDLFGTSVAISGDGNTAIVGSTKQENGSNARVGAAHVYTKSGSTWTAQTTLQPSNLVENDDFGSSVALSQDGNTAVVAAVYKDASGSTDTVGAVYVFTRSGSTWSQEAQLAPADLAVSDYFGDSIAISDDGNILVAGSRSEDPGGITDAGSAYVFTRSGSTWTEQQKIQASDATASDRFGSYASMSGDGSTIAIGARYHAPGGLTSGGAVYVFTESGGTWTEQQKILSDEIAAQDAFCIPSLSEDGNTLIVGAFGANSSITNGGAAYVFTRLGSTWTQVKKLTAKDSQPGDNFGWNLALSNDGTTAIVGANETGNGPGMAYTFDSTAEQFVPVYTTIALSSFSGSLPGTFYPHGVSFNNDGTKAYLDDMEISGSTSFSVAEYSLSTPYDLSTATYTTRKLASYPNLTDTGSTTWNSDGSKIYIGAEMQSGTTDRPRIVEFNVSTPFDISTMSTTPNTYINSTSYTKSLTWNEDGTKLFAAIDSAGILTVTCSTPYSLSGATTAYTQLFDTNTFDVEGRAWGVAFRNNGTEMFILQSQVTDDSIWKFSLGTAYDFTTATLTDTLTTTDYGIDYTKSLTYADGKLIVFGTADVGGSNVNAYTYLDSTIIGSESVPTLWYGDRALATGNNGIPWNTVEYFDITTTTNAAIFGNMQAYEDNRGSVSDTSRAAIAGRSRYDSVGTGGIEYLTIATPGNAQDFGNLVTGGRERTAGASDGTTGLFAGGQGIGATHPYYHIDYITIATTGNAQNFGNLIKSPNEQHAGMGDSTYGLFAGGHEYNVGETNSIDYVNISTPSNASTWGTLTASKGAVSGLANGTYGLIGGGYTQLPLGTRYDTIDYVTIATQGNAASFGVLTVGRTTPGATNNATRGVFLAGQALSGKLQTTEYVTIATPGNAASLLQLTQPLSSLGATSGNP